MFNTQLCLVFLALLTTAQGIVRSNQDQASIEIDSQAVVKPASATPKIEPGPTAAADGQVHDKTSVRLTTADPRKQQKKAAVHANTADAVKEIGSKQLGKRKHQQQKSALESSGLKQGTRTEVSWFAMDLPNREPTPHGLGLKKWLYGILGFQVLLLMIKMVCLCECFSSFGTILVIFSGYYALTQGEMYISTILAYEMLCMVALIKDLVSFISELLCRVLTFQICFVLIHPLLWAAYLAGFFFAHHIWIDWANARHVSKGWHADHVPDYFAEYHDSAQAPVAIVAGWCVACGAAFAFASGGGAAATGAAAVAGGAAATSGAKAADGATAEGAAADAGGAAAEGGAASEGAAAA